MATALLLAVLLMALVIATGAPTRHPGVGLVTLMAVLVGVAQMCLPCGPNASVGVTYPFGQKPPEAAAIGARITVLTLAALASSITSGVVLGFIGRRVVDLDRFGMVAGMTGICIFFGAVSLLGIRRHIPQFDRETSPPWTMSGPYQWAFIDGAMLGLGWATRIQYAVWYVIPIAAFLYADPLVGAVIYGAYGVGRMWGTWLIPILRRRTYESDSVFVSRLLAAISRANSICGIASITVGAVLVTWAF